MKRRRWGAHQSAHSSSGTFERRAGSALLPSPRATTPPPHPALRPPQLLAGPRIRLPWGRTATHRSRFAWDRRRTQPGLKPPRSRRRPRRAECRLLPLPQTTAMREGCQTSGHDQPRPWRLRGGAFRPHLPGRRRRATGGTARLPERAPGSLQVGWKVPVCRATTSRPPRPKPGAYTVSRWPTAGRREVPTHPAAESPSLLQPEKQSLLRDTAHNLQRACGAPNGC